MSEALTDEQRAIYRLLDLLDRASRASRQGSAEVVLHLVGLRASKARRMRIAGQGSPLGEVVGWGRDGTVVMVPTWKLAAWCCARLQELGVEVVVQLAPTGAP